MEHLAGQSVLFDVAHRPSATPSAGLKTLRRKLAAAKLTANKEPLSSDRLAEQNILLLPGPREKFTEAEFAAIKQFIHAGNSVLLTLADGGEPALEWSAAAELPQPRWDAASAALADGRIIVIGG